MVLEAWAKCIVISLRPDLTRWALGWKDVQALHRLYLPVTLSAKRALRHVRRKENMPCSPLQQVDASDAAVMQG